MTPRSRSIMAAVSLALLSACTGQLAEPRVAPVAAPTLGLGAQVAPAMPAQWWKSLADPQLDRIVADALAGNPGLDAALARVRQARAELGVQEADTRPQARLDAQEQRTRLSGKYVIPPPYGGSTQWVGEVNANLSWSLDFWGRQAAAIRQAQSSERAAELDVEAARLALAGAVVQTYLELFRAERTIAAARAEIVARQQAVQLAKVKLHTQLDSELGVRAAETGLDQSQQVLLRAEEARTLAIHALARLAGQGAGYYPTIGATALRLDGALALPTSLPADLLARRPDIAAAMARVDAAREGRDVARRAFYPNINLLGLVGLQALGLDSLLTGGGATYGGGAAIHLPIFDGGRLRAEHGRATAQLDLAVSDYNAKVVDAVRQAADALTQIDARAKDLASQRALAGDLAETMRLNRVRVASGLASRLDLVEPELRELDARIEIARLEAAEAGARVQLILAVGGGYTAAGQTNPS